MSNVNMMKYLQYRPFHTYVVNALWNNLVENTYVECNVEIQKILNSLYAFVNISNTTTRQNNYHLTHQIVEKERTQHWLRCKYICNGYVAYTAVIFMHTIFQNHFTGYRSILFNLAQNNMIWQIISSLWCMHFCNKF